MTSISKKVSYSEITTDIYPAMYRIKQVAVQPQEDLHYEGSGISIVSLDKLEPAYKAAIQAMDLNETKVKVYVRRAQVKFKVRLEQPATGQWMETTLTAPLKGTRESTASTLKRCFINDVLGFRHCTRSEPKMAKD